MNGVIVEYDILEIILNFKETQMKLNHINLYSHVYTFFNDVFGDICFTRRLNISFSIDLFSLAIRATFIATDEHFCHKDNKVRI